MKKASTCNCSNPDIRARWYYIGSELKSASAYCMECNARWKFDISKKEWIKFRSNHEKK